MEFNENGPVYSVGSRNSLTRVLLLVLIAYLLVSGLILYRDALTIVFGLVLAFLVTYTWQTRYQLFLDVLVVRHLWPRVRVLPLAQVRSTMVVRVPFSGEGLLIHRTDGRPVFIRPQDPEELKDQMGQLLGHQPMEQEQD